MENFSLWLEFEEYVGGYPGPNDDPYCDFCNVQIRVGNTFYAANVWTFGYVEQACRDNLSGQPVGLPTGWLFPPYLLVERLDRPTIAAAVEDLLSSGGVPPTWLIKARDNV